MSKIETLTPEQETLLSVYRDKWLKIGLSTEPANHQLAEDALRRSYKIAGLEEPKQIVWTTSPLAGAIVLSILKNEKLMEEILKNAKLKKKTIDPGASVGDSVWASVWASVGDSVWASVGASVGDSVWASVGASVGDSVWASIWDSVWSGLYGQFDANWFGFYDYFREVLKLAKQTEKLIPLTELSKHSNWLFLHKNIAIISEKPTIIKVNSMGKIHYENGPSVQYPDGFSVYALNGIRLSKEIVETPGDKLDSNLVLKEKNAEIRREIVRKIGIERVCKDLKSEIIDKMDDYELILLDLGDNRKRPYLRMKNPSIDTIHIEGVSPDCKTVAQALAFRNGTPTYVKPKILT